MIEQTLNFVRARKQQRKEPGRDVFCTARGCPCASDERVSRSPTGGMGRGQRKPQPLAGRSCPFSISPSKDGMDHGLERIGGEEKAKPKNQGGALPLRPMVLSCPGCGSPVG
jgi:hypothetical protein